MPTDRESTEFATERRLAAWFAGELSCAESAALARWAESGPLPQALVDEARLAWAASARQRGAWDVEALSERLKGRIEASVR